MGTRRERARITRFVRAKCVDLVYIRIWSRALALSRAKLQSNLVKSAPSFCVRCGGAARVVHASLDCPSWLGGLTAQSVIRAARRVRDEDDASRDFCSRHRSIAKNNPNLFASFE